MYTYIYIYTHVYVYVYVCICICICIYIHTHTHTHTHIYIYIYIYIYIALNPRVLPRTHFFTVGSILLSSPGYIFRKSLFYHNVVRLFVSLLNWRTCRYRPSQIFLCHVGSALFLRIWLHSICTKYNEIYRTSFVFLVIDWIKPLFEKGFIMLSSSTFRINYFVWNVAGKKFYSIGTSNSTKY